MSEPALGEQSEFWTEWVERSKAWEDPGGDRGPLRAANSRIAAGMAERLLGEEGWLRMRERWGLGRSLVLLATRNAEAR